MSISSDFNLVKSKNIEITNLEEHHEANEYQGCSYTFLNKSYIQRTSKITPKKIGQFVTLWKRDSNGETCPFDSEDQIDYVVIVCHFQNESGRFLFPKEVLIKKKILTDKKTQREGKRGFRIYPPWDSPTSKQAITTQSWQLEYFESGFNLK